MKKPPLNVFVGRSGVGTLARSDVEDDAFLFGYRRDTPAENAVSLTMPVRMDQYDSKGGLLPIFEMNLPEGALRERLHLLFAKAIPGFDDLDLLAIVGASQIGRLRYAKSTELEESVPEQDLREILTYTGTADLFTHLMERYATHSGVSGMQPKVLLRDVHAPDRLTHAGATHIVKTFDPSDYPELAANELICTRGAAAAGIETAGVQLSANRRFLVVERFDVTQAGEYLGVEDFCVLQGRRAHGRYDGSYEAVAGRIGDFVSADALAHALEQFALQVVYDCAIGNGDAHLKNFSVVYRHPEHRVALAPAYDIVSTRPYFAADSMALTLGGSKSFPDRARLARFVREITGKTEKAAAGLLEQVASGVETAIAQAQTYGRQHRDAARFVERLRAVLQEGLGRLGNKRRSVSRSRADARRRVRKRR